MTPRPVSSHVMVNVGHPKPIADAVVTNHKLSGPTIGDITLVEYPAQKDFHKPLLSNWVRVVSRDCYPALN